MQHFLGDPDSGKLHLETHRLALAIAKKTLDKNRFTASQNTVSRDNPTFNIGDSCVLQKQTTRQVGFEVETRIPDCSYWVQWTLHPTLKTKPQAVHGHATSRISSLNLLFEFWNIDTQFSRASCYVNHPSNLPNNSTQWHLDLVFPSHLIPLHQYCFYSALTASCSHSSLLQPLHRQNQENLYYSNQYYKHTLPGILGSSLLTYHLDSWNATGSSSNGNLLRRNSSLLP